MKISAVAGLVAGLVIATSASSATYVVDARANSSNGGVGLSTLTFDLGDLFSIFVDPEDLWNAGALPRWSNADGLDGDALYATGSDESGQAAGVLIGGATWTFLTQHGLSARYGSLVGEIGGEFRALGTSFSGAAWKAGTLNLYYWDVNTRDNTGSVEVAVTPLAVVPEPSAWAMMIVGFGSAGALLRRRRTASYA